MQAIEPERRANLVDLVSEAADLPEPVVGGVRPSAPELVVEDDLALVGEHSERLEVVVASPGPAVEDEERESRPLAGARRGGVGTTKKRVEGIEPS